MFEQLKNWSERPFNPEMGMGGWAAFILFILIVAGLWASVIRTLAKVA